MSAYTPEELERMAAHVRSFGLCGELITYSSGYSSFCALPPNHPGKHGYENDGNRANEPGEDEDLWSLVEGLVQRIAGLEEQLKAVEEAQKAYNQYVSMLTPKAMLPIVARSDSVPVVTPPFPMTPGTVVTTVHRRFVPDYDSEGTY